MPADPDLDALDALLKAATPGPFYVAQDPEFPSLSAVYVGGPDGDLWASALLPEDAEAFAALVNAAPRLIADARRARIGDAAREVLRKIVDGAEENWEEKTWCRSVDAELIDEARALLEETPDA